MAIEGLRSKGVLIQELLLGVNNILIDFLTRIKYFGIYFYYNTYYYYY